MIKAELLARAGYTYIGRLYDEMDCQAFVEKCLQDCGLKINLAGSNTWFRKMTWTGSPEECKKTFGKIPVGAFLFILKQDGKEPSKFQKDGIGNATHIGIYTGIRKGAIHSSLKNGSVVESRFSGKSISGGWNRVGLWNRVAYDTEINAMLTNMGKTETKKESEGKPMETIYLAGGNEKLPINLRAAASTSASLVAEIPQGSTAELLEGGGTWNWIKYEGKVGYVKSEFVHRSPAEAEEMISIPRKSLEAVYDQIGDLLGLRG